MSDDRPPMTDAEAATYLETLDHLYGRLRPMESRAETVLATARSVGDAEAVTRVEAILNRLGEGGGTDHPHPSGDSQAFIFQSRLVLRSFRNPRSRADGGSRHVGDVVDG